jgi:hypothetical protein
MTVEEESHTLLISRERDRPRKKKAKTINKQVSRNKKNEPRYIFINLADTQL